MQFRHSHERKSSFLLTEQQYQDFLPFLEHYMNPDKFCVGGKEYGIYNVYYDTPDDFLIRESLEKPDYKEKIRLRSYLSPAQPEDTVVSGNQKEDLRHCQQTPRYHDTGTGGGLFAGKDSP